MSHTFINIEISKKSSGNEKNEDSTSVFTIIDLASEYIPISDQSVLSQDKRFTEKCQDSLFSDLTRTQIDLCGYNKKAPLQEYVRRNNIFNMNQLYNYVDKIALNSSNPTSSLLTQLLKQNFNTDYRIYLYTKIESEKVTEQNISCFIQLFEFTQNLKYKIGALLVYRGNTNSPPPKENAVKVGNICDEISKTPTPLTSRGENKEELKSLSKQFDLEDLSKIPVVNNKLSNDNSYANPFAINTVKSNPERGFTFVMENEQSRDVSNDTLARSNRIAQGFAKLTDSLLLTSTFFQNIHLTFIHKPAVMCGACDECKKDFKVTPMEPGCCMINRPFVYAPVFIKIAQQRRISKMTHKLSPPIALSQISIPKGNEQPSKNDNK